MSRSALLLLALLLSAIAAAPAQAGVVQTFDLGDGVVLVGVAGDTNGEVLTLQDVDGGLMSFSDVDGIAVDASAAGAPYNCAVQPGNTTVHCDGQAAAVLAGAGGGDELINYSSSRVGVLLGGDGNDTLSGGAVGDVLNGEGGNDSLVGYGGNDVIDGGEGDDRVGWSSNVSPGNTEGANEGNDDLIGGPGNDSVDYAYHPSAVTVTFDEAANDGPSGQGDNVRNDIEQLTGGNGADTITGNDGAQVLLRGGQGSDVIHGGGGADIVDGDEGTDKVFGDAGDDTVRGGGDSDEVDGGAGLDTLYGDDPCVALSCSGGGDRLLARDGEKDSVNCGVAADTAIVDAVDVVASDGQQNCESVDRAAAPPGPDGTPPPGTTPGTSATAPKAGRLSKALVVAFSCPVGCKVTATLTVPAKIRRVAKLKSTRLASRTATQLAPGAGKVSLKAAAKAVRRLKKVKPFNATLTIKITDAAGKTLLTRKVTVRLRP